MSEFINNVDNIKQQYKKLNKFNIRKGTKVFGITGQLDPGALSTEDYKTSIEILQEILHINPINLLDTQIKFKIPVDDICKVMSYSGDTVDVSGNYSTALTEDNVYHYPGQHDLLTFIRYQLNNTYYTDIYYGTTKVDTVTGIDSNIYSSLYTMDYDEETGIEYLYNVNSFSVPIIRIDNNAKQVTIHKPTLPTGAAYRRICHDYVLYTINQTIYKYNYVTDEHTEVYVITETPFEGGTFDSFGYFGITKDNQYLITVNYTRNSRTCRYYLLLDIADLSTVYPGTYSRFITSNGDIHEGTMEGYKINDSLVYEYTLAEEDNDMGMYTYGTFGTIEVGDKIYHIGITNDPYSQILFCNGQVYKDISDNKYTYGIVYDMNNIPVGMTLEPLYSTSHTEYYDENGTHNLSGVSTDSDMGYSSVMESITKIGNYLFDTINGGFFTINLETGESFRRITNMMMEESRYSLLYIDENVAYYQYGEMDWETYDYNYTYYKVNLSDRTTTAIDINTELYPRNSISGSKARSDHPTNNILVDEDTHMYILGNDRVESITQIKTRWFPQVTTPDFVYLFRWED